MLFGITSFGFFLFLIIALFFYYLLPQRFQWGWLLIASFCFVFLSTGLVSFPFLLVDITVTYLAGRILSAEKNVPAKGFFLFAALAIIVSQLFLLKYLGNMSLFLNKLTFKLFGLSIPPFSTAWIAPIGISYFSLSSIGYILDVYWGSYQAEKNPFKIALFVVWFPALVSGPFVKYGEQRLQLFTPHRFSYLSLKFGLERMLWGLFKKMLIADRLAIITSIIFADTATYGGLFIVVAVVLFAFQIYCDFSGCMDIVIGASETFQIVLPENFEQPFFSRSLSEFWRRWHISLGIWAKEYIMYPLLKSTAFQKLGKRCKNLFGKKLGKKIPTYISMLIIWVIIGIWHGGSAKFILAAGILPWLFIVSGQLLQPVFDFAVKAFRINKDCFSYSLFSCARTFSLMCLIWLFAMTAGDWDSVISAIRSIFLYFNPWILFDESLLCFCLSYKDFSVLFFALLLVFAVDLLNRRGLSLRSFLEEQNLPFQWIVLMGGIFAVLILGIYGPGYNPAAFIYAGF